MLTMLLDRGGWVMVPLLILSVIAVAICLERTWFWFRNHRLGLSARKISVLASTLRSGKTADTHAIIASNNTIYSSLLFHMLKHGWTDAVAVEAVEKIRPSLERFMPALSTIITAAPLLGILGTVSGIIGSFELLGNHQLITDPRDVSGGIAEALLTTEVGLIVALISLFPFMFFKSQIDRAIGRMELLIAAGKQGLSHPAQDQDE